MTMIPCTICSGDGKVEQNRDCPACDGSGEIEAVFGMTEGHYMGMFNMVVELADSLTSPENVVPAYVVLEASDVDEINDLTVPKTRCFNGVLGAGFVDINPGSKAIALLTGAFGESSATMTNIAELR